MLLPSAKFPSTVATDADLKLADNGVITGLLLSCGTADSVLTLRDTSRVTVNMLLTIGREIVSVVSVSGNTVQVLRAFDGTVAASHNAGSPVSANVDAWHHNALAAEIKAIQTALGANLSNLAGTSLGVLEFAAQTPGVSLVIGANAITLTPVPAGVNGTDFGHYLYIDQGTGTAEAVKIIGGAAVAGQASGQIVIQCANTHTGSWRIRSATAGIQEAVQVLQTAGTGGTIQLPAGTLGTYGPVNVSGSGIVLRGAGRMATKIQHHGAFNVVVMDGTMSGGSVQAQNVIERLQIATDSQANGNYGIWVKDQNTASVRDVQVSVVQNGIRVSNGFGAYLSYLGVSYVGTNGLGIWIDGGAEHFIDHVTATSGVTDSLAGIRITQSGGTWLSESDFMQFGFGLLIDPGAGLFVGGVWVTNCAFDTSQFDGVFISPASTGKAHSIFFTNSWTCSGGRWGVYLDSTSGGYVREINFVQHRSSANINAGFRISGDHCEQITISNSTIGANGRQADGSYPGILIDGNAQSLSIVDNYIGPVDYLLPGGLLARPSVGIQLSGSGTMANLVIRGNRVRDYTTAYMSGVDTIFAGAQEIDGNIGASTAAGSPVHSDTILTVASASSVSLGATPTRTYKVTGTTAITTLQPSWTGRRVRLIFTDGAPGGVAGGGNIRKAVTAAQNTCLELVKASDGFWDVS